MKDKMIYGIFSLAVCAMVFSVSSCKGSYDEMLDNFDRKLLETKNKVSSIQSSDFSEAKMIPLENYRIGKYDVFSIQAPNGGETYEWKLSREGLASPIVLDVSQALVYKMPGQFSMDEANYLTLTVTDAAGREYKDKATILLK